MAISVYASICIFCHIYIKLLKTEEDGINFILTYFFINILTQLSDYYILYIKDTVIVGVFCLPYLDITFY